ncbi:hypothetical protein GH714_031987 [Hevea brasiliensis]|uniref:Uncharacterized protein n=1 Tax=Hevea brasiliensis TaxID=3981 RepID=A0A6A6LDG4_HEVBR|nr:hypothetical protein GH714_031987 [Hevea brasiliensis]
MAVLAYCWMIIESIVIPDGFLKWFYLSFYIHPIFLFACQIFLWLKLILKCLTVVFYYPLKITFYVCLYVVKVLKEWVIYVFSFTRLTNTIARDETENFALVHNCNRNQVVTSYSYSSTVAPISCQFKVLQIQKYYVFEEENNFQDDQVSCEDEHMEEQSLFFDEDESTIDDSSSICSSESSSFLNPYKAGSCVHWELPYSSESFTKDANLNRCIPSVCSSNSPASENLETNEYSSSVFCSNPVPEDQDMNEYSESICSFNLAAVVEREDPNNGLEDQDLDAFYSMYTQRMRWFDVLNYDRTCGINAILNEQIVGNPNSFDSIEPVDFSVFPYMSWSKTVRKRLLRSLESDFELVYVAQSCLSWEALHHQYRKLETLANSSSQNGVFYDKIAGEFQKFHVLLERFMEDERKELWLKDSQGKQRCWFRRVVKTDAEESQTKEMLFTMIDMKLISRVLQLPVLSSSHLNWCQAKLDNILFQEGKIFRASTSGPLFPP